jgi:cytosine deaminase
VFVVLPSLVEPHAHLDKALTADRVPNPRGDLAGAIDAWLAWRGTPSVEAIAERARAAAIRYVANGTTLIRTHVDVGDGVGLRAIEAVLRLRTELAAVVDIQVVAAVSLPVTGADGAGNRDLLEAALAAGADLVGGAPWLAEDPEDALRVLLDAASRHGVGADLHLDETTDPRVRTIETLIDVGRDFPYPLTASHVVSLGARDASDRRRIAAELAAAGIGVVTNPLTNLYLQGRGADAAPRGLTALRDLLDAGVTLAAGGDNLRDPFNPVGRADPLETASLLVTAGHLTFEEALAAVTTSARLLVRGSVAADTVAVRAASIGDAVAFAPAERVTRRAGRVVASTLVTTVIQGLDTREPEVARW